MLGKLVVRLTGGLGNQMFQYAYGRSRTIDHPERLRYFFLNYPGNTRRSYELGIFNLKGKKISDSLSHLIGLLETVAGIMIPGVVRGYWQSEKYFISHEKEIREDFQFTRKLDGKNERILKQILSSNSISIHVRRGDYVFDSKTNKFHGALPIHYYTKAIRYIQRTIKQPLYFIFSDDPKWVKQNIQLEHAVYIAWNTGISSYKDMYLMSFCKHNIIANSSFSWWGAWLNRNPNKIVICPKQWHADPSAKQEFNDLIPATWIKV